MNVSVSVGLGRALSAQARSAVGDLPLAGVCVAAIVLSASIGASVPGDLATAPDEARAAIAAPLSTVIAMYGAVMAAIYGSFRYTVDRRAGVVAQRATLQPRRWHLAARIPFTALSGALVAVASLLGGRLALTAALGLRGLDLGSVGISAVIGAAAALWGLGIGLLVQAHLPALFVAPLSLISAFLIAPLWPSVAAWLPLPTLLRAVGRELGPLGIDAAVGPVPAAATALAAVWIAAVLSGGAWSFLRRDLR
ncbi:hypothetical protein [Microbacterium sp. NPDC086615]|jgi:hypothetical protein|uniref:hypothetical protein n=1 Tax=Microbacterium sp. NPDC086615 TaxID=3154865 RepID=UPI0034481176|nr:hypothetical protein [Microbacterium sp.]